MSTIASPREPPRRLNLNSPSSSTRPSIDSARSPMLSPNPNASLSTQTANPRRNRAALREYYNIRKSVAGGTATPPQVEVTDALSDARHEHSEVPSSEMDKEDFDADAFVKRALAENGMQDLLRLYTRVLSETRALDAEKKALVYDNYSKLITATETIRKMRMNMDPLNPMASTLDPAIAKIYKQASEIRDALRKSVPEPTEARKAEEEAVRRRLRTRQLAIEVLDTPDKIRALVSEGRLDDAREAWKLPRKLLLVWKEQGVGGDDVDECIADGDAAILGEPSKAKWRELRNSKARE
ncbi:Vps51/Vps67-domain-containing protein [Xylaria sp. CBS 124048]|nr:Vps51/Vps67-domain-containing protein [Xylaria sp. CBS 124048]